jgi:hypothetical protein
VFLAKIIAAPGLAAAAGSGAEHPISSTLVFYSGGPAAPHVNPAKEFMQR